MIVWPHTTGHPMRRILPMVPSMAIFQYKIIVFQGLFHIISAFSIESSEESWHLYCNSQYLRDCMCP